MNKIKEIFKNNKFIDVPHIKDVEALLHYQKASDTYFSRGSGEATKELNHVESIHRDWVSK